MKTNLLVTNKDWLAGATKKLFSKQIESAQLDSIIILCFSLNVSKIEILSNPNKLIPQKALNRANRLLDNRLENYPISYLIKSIDFFGRTFYVDSRVLSPRPESESFINLLKSIDISNLNYLTDIGCGSGVLGITAKLEFPSLQIELLDKSKAAIAVSRINLTNFKLDAIIKKSDLLDNSEKKFDIIIANLPYVPDKYPISSAAKFEPKMAIFAGKDGLNIYRKLISQLKLIERKPKYILVECLDSQIDSLENLFKTVSYQLYASEGLVHLFINK